MSFRITIRGTTGAIRPPSQQQRFAVVAVAVAAAASLCTASYHLVPTSAGLWRGMVNPPGAAQLALAVILGVIVSLGFLGLPWRCSRLVHVAFVAALPLVPLFTGWGRVLLFLQGPTLLVIAAAAIGMMLMRRRQRNDYRPAPAALFALGFVLFLALGLRLPGAAGPQGDEPHYLLMARSLVADRDLDLANDFAQRQYAPFYSGVLEAHTSPRSPKGRIYAVHAPGLPALLAPGYAAAGYFGVRVLIALLAAATAALTYKLCAEVCADRGAALVLWLALVCTAPFALYATSVYPEMPAAFATAVFLLTSRKDPGARALGAAAACAALLPWIHPKFLPLAAAGLLLTVARRGPLGWRRAAVASFALSLALLAFFFVSHYGSPWPSAAYGPGYGGDVSLLHAPLGLLGFLFDRQHGLLFLSPVWLLAIPGVPLLARERMGDALRAGVLAAATLLVGASFSMWWGGACPPGRFVVPALPALALFVSAVAMRRHEVTAALCGVGTAVLVLAAWAPRVLHNRGDGESALLRFLAPALDLDSRLPSLFFANRASIVLLLCLVAVLVLAWRYTRYGSLGGVVGYAAVATLVAGTPILDGRGATEQLLSLWWQPRLSVGNTPPPSLRDLSLPLDLPDSPWVLAPGDQRNSRRFELPAGVYRLEADLRRELGGAALLRAQVFAGDAVLAAGNWRASAGSTDATAALDATVPEGARRLQVSVAAVEGRSRVAALRLIPLALAASADQPAGSLDAAVKPQDTPAASPSASPAPKSMVDEWRTPTTPARIVGPIYYVGTRDLGVYLFTTPAGHILLDGAVPGAAPEIVRSIRALGFKPEDIRILLISQAHFDHVGTLAALKKATGATVMVMAGDEGLVRDGGASDYLFARDPGMRFEPVSVERVLHDGETVALGNIALRALRTPGHTPGTTTWTTSVRDRGRRYSVVFPGSTSINPGTRLGAAPSYPGIADDFRHSFEVLAGLRPDIFLTAHAVAFDFEKKRERAMLEGPPAYVDPAGYAAYVAAKRADFEKALSESSGRP